MTSHDARLTASTTAQGQWHPSLTRNHMESIMTKRQINTLLCKCIGHEDNATTPQGRQYWDRQYKRLRALAKRVGWID